MVSLIRSAQSLGRNCWPPSVTPSIMMDRFFSSDMVKLLKGYLTIVAFVHYYRWPTDNNLSGIIMLESTKKRTSNRGIYLLPNLFTISALFGAYFSIVSAMKANYVTAAVAIFFCMIADALDGRIARLMNAQSDFGAQLDSLSDMVSFGVAPSLLVYHWSLVNLGKLGWLIAFMFTASVALRLARFNTQIGVADKRYFQGLSCTAGAAFLAGSIWLAQQMQIPGYAMDLVMAMVTTSISLLMVSNIRYYSFKDIDFLGHVPFLHILLVVIIFVAIGLYPALILTLGFGAYALSGPIHTLVRLRHRRLARRKAK